MESYKVGDRVSKQFVSPGFNEVGKSESYTLTGVVLGVQALDVQVRWDRTLKLYRVDTWEDASTLALLESAPLYTQWAPSAEQSYPENWLELKLGDYYRATIKRDGCVDFRRYLPKRA